jgi:hypothetical protein|tara:strand:+ start:628 stop:840 length:213 start_codon:yes stop_codon:yes gene_type:complete
MTQKQKDAMTLAQINGIVRAGDNHTPAELPLEERARMQTVHWKTLSGLISKGQLIKAFSPEGGYAGRLPR